jgi:multidrug efflux pump
MLARFFIDRPIFAWVISIVIVLAGVISYVVLPLAQYPEITPPSVQVTCSYPGANARVVADTVAAPIEQQVNGVEGMMYMSSTSANDGSYTLTVTFELGVNLNMAQVLVQNRVNQAIPKLPQEVQATGVTVNKKSPAILLVVNLYSDTDPTTLPALGASTVGLTAGPTGTGPLLAASTLTPGRDQPNPLFLQLYLSNYATIQVKDELARLKGVGDITLLGQQDYSMRVWVDPEKLASRNLTANDVVNAVKEQNVQVAAGQIGQPPVPQGQSFQYSMSTLGRLLEPRQFESIVIKTGQTTELTYLRDVAWTQLGAQNMNTDCRLDGKPSVGLAIFQLPGSNALAVAKAVKTKMKELEERFPQGMRYTIAYDTTPFVEESVHEVLKTLVEAIVLVVLVVLFFLQDWKAVILPLIDVIVSLVGTLAILLLMGFSLNNLTLFGLVLAIGIVVDDAIVVLENIERWLAKGLPVREATIKAMDEITGPIIGITLVLCAVFLPSAFLPGISGQFYRQFALTIAASMIISAINAMTMTPARAASIFGHRKHGEHGSEGHEALPWWAFGLMGGLASLWWLLPALGPALGLAVGGGHGHGASESHGHAGTLPAWAGQWIFILAGFVAGGVVGLLIIKPVNRALAKFFGGFNKGFDRLTALYGRGVGRLLRVSAVVLVVYAGLLGLTAFGFTRVPTGFIPMQDQGYLVVDAQLPDSASLERSVAVIEHVGKIARETEGVGHTIGVAGQSFVLNTFGSNFAGMFITLRPFEERRGPHLTADAIMARVRQRCGKEILGARVAVFGAPPVQGLGNTGGFKLMVQDRGNLGLGILAGQADTLAEKANKTPGLVGVFNSFRANTPQLYVDVNREKVKSFGVPLSDVFQTLQVFLGGYYVNDFNFEGRTWQVNVQADARYRLSPEKVRLLQVRNVKGEMVPLGSVLTVRDSSGPVLINRYNMHTAAAINGSSRPGVSTGTVITEMEALARKTLPPSMGVEWTELTYLQTQAGGAAIFAFVGAVVLVFLVLAAQYESWSLPLAIILVVPMCLLCALAGVALARQDINIFVQVGFVVLVGLASKNAILVVEFAKERQREGVPAYEATLEASRDRLRPIVMTSLAFILGVVPLVLASGAGAEMRHTLGVAVFSGMLGVTLFGIFLTPVFYYVIMRLTGQDQPRKPQPEPPVVTGVDAAPSVPAETDGAAATAIKPAAGH